MTVTFDVLTLPVEGPAPESALTALVLDGVSRIAASLRNGLWNDLTAPVESLELAELSATVDRLGGHLIYGCEFIDPPESSWLPWRHRLSLDARLAESPGGHVLELFQEPGPFPRHLDVRIWFDTLRVTDLNGVEIPLQDSSTAERAGGTVCSRAIRVRVAQVSSPNPLRPSARRASRSTATLRSRRPPFANAASATAHGDRPPTAH